MRNSTDHASRTSKPKGTGTTTCPRPPPRPPSPAPKPPRRRRVGGKEVVICFFAALALAFFYASVVTGSGPDAADGSFPSSSSQATSSSSSALLLSWMKSSNTSTTAPGGKKPLAPPPRLPVPPAATASSGAPADHQHRSDTAMGNSSGLDAGSGQAVPVRVQTVSGRGHSPMQGAGNSTVGSDAEPAGNGTREEEPRLETAMPAPQTEDDTDEATGNSTNAKAPSRQETTKNAAIDDTVQSTTRQSGPAITTTGAKGGEAPAPEGGAAQARAATQGRHRAPGRQRAQRRRRQNGWREQNQH
ncbi:hypothetical protein PR202_gb15079 [Eleusine coracana subsp. coracana]|uniref:Transmembrane protein n=1 Tax=Eleusine coracana subsp. coracana TaxID=191504 RepID=A0AAV5EY23_ELECO|nr:hypothetical protein PR202_gb15079 [Eleusine coracana subsp. coracana]